MSILSPQIASDLPNNASGDCSSLYISIPLDKLQLFLPDIPKRHSNSKISCGLQSTMGDKSEIPWQKVINEYVETFPASICQD